MVKKIIFILILSMPLGAKAKLNACFTPGQNCTQQIVEAINDAHKTVLVQAYSFTSAPILQAMVDAKERGIDVKIILDKSQYKPDKYRSSTYLLNHSIPVWIDNKVAIAHNKVIIIDGTKLITGSFNFTKAAQDRNAENVLFIENEQETINDYVNNWLSREGVSFKIN